MQKIGNLIQYREDIEKVRENTEKFDRNLGDANDEFEGVNRKIEESKQKLDVGLGRFDHFHFRFGFGQFLTKNRGLGFLRFGFHTLTATITSSLQLPDVDITSPDALRRWWQPAFASLAVSAE